MENKEPITTPRIEKVAWGKVLVSENGESHEYKDAKIFPGGSRAWDWNETGTRHDPGIQTADVEELLGKGTQAVVLSQGYFKRLKVPRETKEYLESRGVDVDVLPTGKAVDRFNELRMVKPAACLIHSTC